MSIKPHYYLIFMLLLVPCVTFAATYQDDIEGRVDVPAFLRSNPLTRTHFKRLNPVDSFYWFRGRDVSGKIIRGNIQTGYFFNSPLGNIADNETQFLSFEMNARTLFSGESGRSMHLVVSMRGKSLVPEPLNLPSQEIDSSDDEQLKLRGRGPIFHHTEGHPAGCFGIGIEDYTLNATKGVPDKLKIPLCESYEQLKRKNNGKSAKFQDYSRYRIDVHASKNWIAYWLFKSNGHGSLIPWTLVAQSGAYTPEQHPDAMGMDSIIIGTAGRKHTGIGSDVLRISNVYVTKWRN